MPKGLDGKPYDTTMFGDRVPTAHEWLLLLSGRITMEHQAFHSVVSWEIKENMEAPVVLEVAYISGREESYAFSMECCASGMVVSF